MIEIISVRFKNGGKQYYFNPNGLKFEEGDGVVVETSRGVEYGECTQPNTLIDEMELTAPLRPVLRAATIEDKETVEKNREKEAKAFQVCQDKITEHGLDMKLVEVEYSFEGNKILFFFTSEGRVDFRALVKDLAGTLHARIELRQIGVRDEAKMLGGLGICGRPFCCAQFLNEFQPVSIKMAKTQNLSLNPTKISGTCGRLMCCLKYEQDAYEDLLRSSPKAESFVDTPDGRGTVVEVDLLRQRVKVRMEDSPETISVFANADIAVLRSGKAKKNDPPIPADLAPISGSGKRAKKEKTEEDDKLLLEPIRFRYSTEQVVEAQEAPVETADTAEEQKEGKSSRSRRRRRGKGEGAKAEQGEQKQPEQKTEPKKEQPKKQEPKKEQPQKEASPAQEAAAGEDAAKKSRRRNNYRRHRRPKTGGEG